ncbi:type II toxin-antitoxin system prevent-host-death family antitoxin [Actinosynnema sp. NPDC051121]
MKEMAASEASRNFSAVLDEAEHGETIVVTRNGRRVAMITPAPRANGRALHDVFDRWRGRAGLDEDFEAGIAAAREAASGDLDSDPWRD